jgi:hypothetical protein
MPNELAVLLALALAGCVAYDIRSDVRRVVSGRNVVLFGIFVWFLVEPIRVPDDLLVFDPSEYVFGLGCVGLAMTAFLIGYHNTRFRWFDGFAGRLWVLNNNNVQWRVFLVALAIGIAPMLIVSDFDPSVLLEGVFGFGKRWTGVLARGRYGGVRDALLELQMFLKAALPAAVLVVLNPRAATGRRTVCAVFVAWMTMKAANSATRSELVQVGMPILAGVYCRIPAPRQRLAVMALPALMAVGYLWSAAVVVSRTSGRFDWSDAGRAEYAGNEMFRELLFLITRVPDRLDYLYGETYLTQLVNPIPRFLWPGKPTSDAGLLLAKANGEVLADGEAYLTRSPGLIGEMYWNFGILGVIGLSALGGAVVRAWDRLPKIGHSSPPAFLVHCAGLSILFLFGRSFNLPPMYGLLSLAVLLYLTTSPVARNRIR